MTLLPKRENQTKEDLEYDFKMAMDWLPCANADKEEYKIELNIGQMQLLKEAVEGYKDKLKTTTRDEQYDSAYGISEDNCDEILRKIRSVQEYIHFDFLTNSKRNFYCIDMFTFYTSIHMVRT